jgi:hypothetical protein
MRNPRVFLLVTAALFLPVFAIPLFVDPYWWAERFGWDTGPETELGQYLGRCLGAVAIAIMCTALAAARDPERNRAIFTVLGTGGVLLAIVHLRGLIEDAQPLVEHIETAMYAGFGAFAFWVRPASDAR